MPLFYFDIVEQAGVKLDDRGEVFVDPDSAIRQATMMARERASFHQYMPCYVEVKNSTGETIAKISVAKKPTFYLIH